MLDEPHAWVAAFLIAALPDAVFPFIQLLHGSGRTAEAIAVLDRSLEYAARNPTTRGDATPAYRQLREQLAGAHP